MAKVNLYNILFEQQDIEEEDLEQTEDLESIEIDTSIIPSTPSDKEMETYLDSTFYKPASSSDNAVVIGEEVEVSDDGLDQVDDSDPGFMLINL